MNHKDYLNPASPKCSSLALINGKIYTLNTTQPQAEAVLIWGNKIAAVGTTTQIISSLQSHTKVIDVDGKFVLPGFNDAHLHFNDGAYSLSGVDLRDASDEGDFADRIKRYARSHPPGTWIIGGNWDHEQWPGKKHPGRGAIDSFTPEHPVFVSRIDLHIALANHLALKLANINRDTPDPAGGKIVKDPATGEPTGILIDKACDLVLNVIPAPSFVEKKKIFKDGLKHAAQFGITSFQDNSSQADFRVYQSLLRDGELTARVSSWFAVEEMEYFINLGLQANFGRDMLRIGTVKIYADGSMGAGSALFFEPYTDDPATCGLALSTEEELNHFVLQADSAGLQMAIHAIGDKANHLVLNALETAYAKNGKKERRHRIEHAQVVAPPDVLRFKKLGVIASIQPSHVINDKLWAETRIGKERCRYAYRVGSFLKHDIPLAFGTDWPVEAINPLLGIYVAVTRESVTGEPDGGWFPDEKISVEHAIKAYTQGPAYAEYAEHDKGSIEVGKLADIVVLTKNLLKIPPQEILHTEVVYTIMDGEIVYHNERLG